MVRRSIVVFVLLLATLATVTSAATVTARMRDGRTVVLYDAVVEQEAFNPSPRDVPLLVRHGGVEWDLPWYEVRRVDVLSSRGNVMTGRVTLVDGRRIDEARLGRFTVIQGWAAPEQGGGLVTVSTWKLRYAVFEDQLAPYAADAGFDDFEEDFGDDEYQDDYQDDFDDDFAAAGEDFVPADAVSCFAIVYFDFDRSAIRPDQLPTITDLVSRLEVVADPISVVGHASPEDTVEYNQVLSERRAQSVVAELVERGIGEDRITWSGASELQPRYDNSTEEGRSLNRRVEVDCY